MKENLEKIDPDEFLESCREFEYTANEDFDSPEQCMELLMKISDFLYDEYVLKVIFATFKI